jgi:hypothetical protein
MRCANTIWNMNVICYKSRYKSRKLKEHERNYVTHDLELAVVIHALTCGDTI